jgi:all-trans-8'-apo-beta-carotenal 15,15'-oxygenase
MSLPINRRNFLASAAASMAAAMIITPEQALAGALPPRWAAAVADIEGDSAEAALHLIHGKAPTGFTGTLWRNGPAKFRRGTSAAGHWFDGDGLVRRWRVQDGQASLTTRFVDTPKRRLETRLNAIVTPGFGTPSRPGAQLSGPDDANAANTGLMNIGGDLLALWEGGSAVRLDPDSLATRGFKTFRDDLKGMPFSAHPRIERDGSVWNFGGGGQNCVLWNLRADGSLAKAEVIKLPRPSYFHDFTITSRHIVIVLQPWLQESFKFPLASAMVWRPETGTQVLVIDKADLTKQRIFELPAFSFFHLGDGWDEADGTIRFDGCFEADPTFGQRAAGALLVGEHIPSPRPKLTQVVLRPTGSAELIASGVEAEFPQNDRRFTGLARRYTTHVSSYRDTPFPQALARWDWQRGRSSQFDFGNDQLVEEFLFVPTGDQESEGWLIGTTLNLAAGATELHLLNPAHLERGPLVSWRSTLALPLGFHGTFQHG